MHANVDSPGVSNRAKRTFICVFKHPMSNERNSNDDKFLPSVRKEAAVLSSKQSTTTTTKSFEDRIIEKMIAADVHDSKAVAPSTEQMSVSPFCCRIIQNLPDGSQKITTTTTITHPDGRKEVTTHEVIVPSGTDIPIPDNISNKTVCLEQVDDAVEPIPLVQRVELDNEDEAKQKKEQFERSRIHHNHHHNHHQKRRTKRSAVHRAPDDEPSLEEQPHEPRHLVCTDSSTNDHSNTTSTATSTSNPSTAIQIHDEEAAPTSSCPCTTNEDTLGSIYIPEATLVDDNPDEYKFLKKNIAIVASTLLVVVVLIVILFVTTEKKNTKDREQNTTATIGDQKPNVITSSKPESSLSPDPEERFFVCEDINDEIEGCLDADCVGDSIRCKCKAYHRVKATKEITGYCDSCTVCDDLLIMMGFECSNLAEGYPEATKEEAHPHGPLGSNQCASAETKTPPSRAPFGWDKPFSLCFTLPNDPTQEGCVEATCLITSKNCSCQMYYRWSASKNIISYCETCEVCGPQYPIPLAGNCDMTPEDMGGVELSCADYPSINATESELFKIDGAV
jgi:hypothetical protein